jgi:hypothetical protein
MLSTLMRSLVQLENGRYGELLRLEADHYCRRCGASISPHDLFGFGEGVCPSCRR